MKLFNQNKQNIDSNDTLTCNIQYFIIYITMSAYNNTMMKKKC